MLKKKTSPLRKKFQGGCPEDWEGKTFRHGKGGGGEGGEGDGEKAGEEALRDGAMQRRPKCRLQNAPKSAKLHFCPGECIFQIANAHISDINIFLGRMKSIEVGK